MRLNFFTMNYKILIFNSKLQGRVQVKVLQAFSASPEVPALEVEQGNRANSSFGGITLRTKS